MPDQHNFEYLRLLRSYQGPARLRGGGTSSPQTIANRQARQAHSTSLRTAAQTLTAEWQARRAGRDAQGLPAIPSGLPVLLQIDTGLDLDILREKYAFEIVAEQEEGYVIVASEDIEIAPFLEMVNGYSVEIRGTTTVAQIHRLFDQPADRLRRILSERLLLEWPSLADDQIYIVDIGIACAGVLEIPTRPKRGKRTSDAKWAAQMHAWSEARVAAYDAWDALRIQREAEIDGFVAAYQAEILHLVDEGDFETAVLPDSFTVRLRVMGKGLRDFVLNYAYIFEVVEPEDIALPQAIAANAAQAATGATPTAPSAEAPAVCVIDSGIQEGHYLLQPAIDHGVSHCFLPGKGTMDVADQVVPGGHGTRVSGAILYGETVPKTGAPQLPFWIQNARVLDEQNKMPVELFPPEALRAVIQRFHNGMRHTRIFNHSINASGYCRVRYMSAWAAEIDALCAEYDVLLVQSAGNLPLSGASPYIGIKDHIQAGRDYPAYLGEDSARVANPGQSLQALTVGSVAYGATASGAWSSFASQPAGPSAFSRSGPGIWNVVKPEVVEYGGDSARTSNQPVDVQDGGVISAACPELLRSTLVPPGPAFDRDATGTSFAAPKVTRIAARLEQILPGESALLYRALIVQSAQWPGWAEELLTKLRIGNSGLTKVERAALLDETSRAMRCIGYGVPDESRATRNTEHRTTFITPGDMRISPGECHFYQVPIPGALRQPGDDFDIRVDVTLSYVAQPRRTRRNLRRYLSTWLDWKSNRLLEPLADFRERVMKDAESDGGTQSGSVLPWTLHEMPQHGLVRGVKRNSGTVQKDWAVVKSNSLPDQFCIAVVGHQGWSRDPDSTARYALTVTLEILGQEINIYEPLRAAVIELQAAVEAQVGTEIEVNVDG